ncbi:uncharacterized protein [Nicotiana tomentosiformis]|uniref:uncharacterized protein n=1 Tax=Nicotiana tomentosiformis TaxID=4098 RepID=UPI00388C4C03
MKETGAAQGMTRTGRVYTPKHLGGISKEAASKLPVIETGPDDLWRKVQVREYYMVDHLNKTPNHISILSLLQNSETHRNALMTVLSESYVPTNITSGEIANMVGQVLKSHKITFHEDELPPEGLSHNMALHITVQFEDKFIARVLIDGGSSLNICPLTTMKRLGKGLHEIRVGSMNVKAFDGSQRAIIGEIHVVVAVDSTLHHAVKFEWNHQEVVIHGDGSNPIYTNQIVPLIENRRKLDGETYHRIERINAIEKDKWWSNKIESIVLWTGYESGKGLSKNLQGITKPTIHQADEIWGSAEDEVLAGMRKLFLDDEDMDCSAIVEEEEYLTIQTVEKGVVLKNWTTGLSRALLFFIFSLYNVIITYPDEPTTVTCNETTQHKDSDSEDLEDDIIPENIVREVENFENKPKSNLDEIETVDLGDSETVKETRVSIHLSLSQKDEYIRFLKEYEDIFAWSYDDVIGLSTSIVAHKLPTDPMCPHVKQKLRKFKPDMSLKIKEEVTTQIKAKVLRVYVDDIIIKSRKSTDHIADLKKFFDRLRRFNLKLNPAKCAFGVPTGKFLVFIISHQGIELDPSKVKAIQDLPPPKNKKDVMSFLGRLNYISRFIAQSTMICEPIFKMLKKDAATSWTEECQKTFDKIKEY